MSIPHARTFIPKQNNPHIKIIFSGIDITNNNLGIQRHSHRDVEYEYPLIHLYTSSIFDNCLHPQILKLSAIVDLIIFEGHRALHF